jgi:hypothetical protein
MTPGIAHVTASTPARWGRSARPPQAHAIALTTRQGPLYHGVREPMRNQFQTVPAGQEMES